MHTTASAVSAARDVCAASATTNEALASGRNTPARREAAAIATGNQSTPVRRAPLA
jgi:hypothetical protein